MCCQDRLGTDVRERENTWSVFRRFIHHSGPHSACHSPGASFRFMWVQKRCLSCAVSFTKTGGSDTNIGGNVERKTRARFNRTARRLPSLLRCELRGGEVHARLPAAGREGLQGSRARWTRRGRSIVPVVRNGYGYIRFLYTQVY